MLGEVYDMLDPWWWPPHVRNNIYKYNVGIKIENKLRINLIIFCATTINIFNRLLYTRKIISMGPRIFIML